MSAFTAEEVEEEFAAAAELGVKSVRMEDHTYKTFASDGSRQKSDKEDVDLLIGANSKTRDSTIRRSLEGLLVSCKNTSEAARRMGISRGSLLYWFKKYGLSPAEFRKNRIKILADIATKDAFKEKKLLSGEE